MKTIGLDRISPSMLLEYESCPKLFYYRSFLGIKLPQPQVHLEFGHAMHEAIGNIYNQYDNKDKWKLSELKIAKDVFIENFRLEHVDEDLVKEGETKEEIYDKMLKDGLEILKDFWKEKDILRAKGVNPTIMELPIKIQAFNPETKEPLPIPISCRIDGINEAEDKITEFKTSSKIYDYAETRNSPQSLSYVWVRFCQTGRIHTVDYVVMLKKKKSDRIQHLAIEYEMADLLAFDKRVRAILEKIKNKEFERPLKGHPFFCDCTKFENLLKIENNEKNSKSSKQKRHAKPVGRNLANCQSKIPRYGRTSIRTPKL